MELLFSSLPWLGTFKVLLILLKCIACRYKIINFLLPTQSILMLALKSNLMSKATRINLFNAWLRLVMKLFWKCEELNNYFTYFNHNCSSRAGLRCSASSLYPILLLLLATIYLRSSSLLPFWVVVDDSEEVVADYEGNEQYNFHWLTITDRLADVIDWWLWLISFSALLLVTFPPLLL